MCWKNRNHWLLWCNIIEFESWGGVNLSFQFGVSFCWSWSYFFGSCHLCGRTKMCVKNLSWKHQGISGCIYGLKPNNHTTLLVYVIQVKLKISQEIAIVDYANVTGCLLPGPTMGLKFRFHFPFFSQFFDEKINIWIAHRFSNVHGYKSGNFGEKSRENAGAWKLKCFFINYFKPLWLDGQQCSDQWLRWLLFMQKFISGSSKNDVTIF